MLPRSRKVNGLDSQKRMFLMNTHEASDWLVMPSGNAGAGAKDSSAVRGWVRGRVGALWAARPSDPHRGASGHF